MDVDLTLLTDPGSEAVVVDQLLACHPARIDDARDFALSRRVVLLADGHVGIDIALGSLAFEKLMVQRVTVFEYLPGMPLRTCTAEDLIILKAFADRLRDWADIETVIQQQHGNLDVKYIQDHLRPLVEAKESPSILDRLTQMLQTECCKYPA